MLSKEKVIKESYPAGKAALIKYMRSECTMDGRHYKIFNV